MIELDKILEYSKKNKVDQWEVILHLKRYINLYKLKSVFINDPDDWFIANYIKSIEGKVCINTDANENLSHFERYDNCKLIIKPYDKVNLRPYDLVHINATHLVDDIDIFANRMASLSPKIFVLAETKLSLNQATEMIANILVNGYIIDKVYNGYKGVVILKKQDNGKI